MQFLYRFIARVSGKNLASTPTPMIVEQMNEMRALPMGRTEFHEWADRIIAGAMIIADPNSQKFDLANMILSLGPTEDHKPDAFFMKSLRKLAANQVADALRTEIRDETKARTAAAEAETKVN